jgi:hypothetical protein
VQKLKNPVFMVNQITMNKNFPDKNSYQKDKRLQYIASMLREIRLSEGKNQDSFAEQGISRRQIQRAEYGFNISILKLCTLLQCYGYKLSDLGDVEP